MRDRLSQLSFDEAAKLLGRDGKRLLIRGGGLELQSFDQLRIDDEEARLEWEPGPDGHPLEARISFDPSKPGRLRLECSWCTTPCEHIGGLLSIVLEQKTDLGLAAPPPERVHDTDEEALVAREIADRASRAKKERMRVASSDPSTPWTDYQVMSAISGKTYRVALRSEVRGESYCSCPDFKTNSSDDTKEKRQAEFLVHDSFPWSAVERIGVKSAVVAAKVQTLLSGSAPPIAVQPSWYY